MKYIFGDIIKIAQNREVDIIVHGCNCQGNFGAGLAPQIGKAFPAAEIKDRRLYEQYGVHINHLGTFSFVEYRAKKMLTVVNAYTQYYGGANFDIDALRMCLRKINHYFGGVNEIKENIRFYNNCPVGEGNNAMLVKLGEELDNAQANKKRIALPLIGAGIGGGDWNEIQKVIQQELTDLDVTIVVWEGETNTAFRALVPPSEDMIAKFWKLVDTIDWMGKGQKISTEDIAYDIIAPNYTFEEFLELEEIYYKLDDAFCHKFHDFWLDSEDGPSDDGYSDLASSVVGKGKKFYDTMMKFDSKAQAEFERMGREHDYHENFGYIFQCASSHSDTMTQKNREKYEQARKVLS